MLPLLTAAAMVLPAQQIEGSLIVGAVSPVMAANAIPGAVIAITRGDTVLMVHAFGKRDVATRASMRTSDRFLVGSITKLFTATLLAQAAQRGELSLDDPVGRYLDPTQPQPAWAQTVTLRQLATHTASLPRNPVNRRDVPGSPSVMLPYSRAELYAGLVRTTLDTVSGSRWGYSNLGYAILGEVVERATGRRYEDLLRERLLTPLGMTNTGIANAQADETQFPSGYWPDDREPQSRPRWMLGEVVGFAGIYATAEDLGRFLIAQYGGLDGVLAPALRATLQTPTAGVTVAPGRAMGLGWFIETLPGGLPVIGGGGEVDSYSGAVAFLARQRIGIVVLANRGGDSAELIMRSLMGSLLPVVLARPR